MSCDQVDLGERLYYFQTNTCQIRGRGAFRKRFWSRKPDGTGFDTSRAPVSRFGHLPLVRDRKTQRAMERQALHGSEYFMAGTRAEHKRPSNTVDAIAREAAKLRVARRTYRENVQRLRRSLRRGRMRFSDALRAFYTIHSLQMPPREPQPAAAPSAWGERLTTRA